MDQPIIIYMTCADEREAETIAHALLEQKLIACANIMPAHTAVFRWEGKVQSSPETAVILKSVSARFDKIKEVVLSLHSYECPCIVSWPIEKGHAPFLQWIKDETAA